MKRVLFTIIVLTIGQDLFAQKADENVIYKYREHESFDLGSLEIQGQIIAPGDLSIQQRSRNDFSTTLYDRTNFIDVIKREANHTN